MKISIIGAGAMGSVLGGRLARGGNEVTLVDVSEATVQAINRNGLRIEDGKGNTETIQVRATSNPAEVGPVDLVLVFVKCYHTDAALRNAARLIGPQTVVLSLQNGWGNGPRISAIVGEERLLLGVCYHSATVMGPGYVQHGGKGSTYIGELDGRMSDRLIGIADCFNRAGIETTATPTVFREIWSKLALNVCTLSTSALLRFTAPQLIQHDSLLELMRALLREAISVANAQGVPLEFDERWQAIKGLLGRCAPGVKASMLQDVEKGRRTEIEVINGAIVEAGRRLNIPTPYNDSMYWLVKSLEETFSLPPGI
jgi:2-dehydropantoate 2-reductase